jgi:glycosyltransferase involved in cell wall biosynthesis
MTPASRPESDGKSPAVSVIMPVLNARLFLPESINSILTQSYGDYELLIVDNGSTDGSREYAESLGDPRIRVLSVSRRGAAYAINAGIRASRADLLAIADADDISIHNRLEMQSEYLRDHPHVVLLGARFSFLIGNVLVPTAPPLTRHQDIVRALRDGSVAITNGTAMFRKWAARAVGGHRLNGPAHDFDFFLRMSEIGAICNLQETLYVYRLHYASSTARTANIITAHKRFSIACARAREARQPEPTFFEFSRVNQTPQGFFYVADRARGISAELYRKSLFLRAADKHVRANISVLFSAALNPSQVVWRLKREIRGLKRTTLTPVD